MSSAPFPSAFIRHSYIHSATTAKTWSSWRISWNTLRDRLRSQGEAFLLGSRDTLRDRRLTSHTYNLATADAIAAQIIDCYLPCFQQLRTRLEQRVQEEAP
ncbi:hypothetical protein KBY72_06995 [Cyanobium sp. BA5m-21]|uniref:nucleotidyltransferase substrate binding protein n=1 Tax=unclassified Cyanobium TaxID=2627006 RepID=UPI0020CF2A0E|nr:MULTISPECIES: nucleotidyltransferase substrate binding protein [unclassified Cyanobium]MCP9905566.1 hypothetical protein [Cyanobium sp. BA5m-10]MCP9906926.1 hypothetical protein [Cyanobium sp. BA5m-21]